MKMNLDELAKLNKQINSGICPICECGEKHCRCDEFYLESPKRVYDDYIVQSPNSQTQTASLCETLTGTALGLLTANLTWFWVIMPLSPLFGWQFYETGLVNITAVNIIFTIVSFVRSFLIRRFFNWLWEKGWVR